MYNNNNVPGMWGEEGGHVGRGTSGPPAPQLKDTVKDEEQSM